LIASFAIASETSIQVERILKDINWKPDKIITNECGTVFFVWENKKNYADIECTCEGEVLYGITNFNEINKVGELKLNIQSFLDFKKEYEKTSESMFLLSAE